MDKRRRAHGLTPVLLPVLALSGCGGGGGGGAGVSNDLPVYCLTTPDPGTCKGREARYWYDFRTDSCKTFWYGGCGGRVPFETREACAAQCMSAP